METNGTLMHYATDFENITIELGELEALLQLYSEHRDTEMEWLTMEGAAAGAIKSYLDRDCMADALLTVIYTKARSIRNMVRLSTQEAYQKAKEN